MSKKNDEVFASFKPQPKSKKKQQEDAIEYAKKISKEMEESKVKARENFLLKLLENAKAINEAREDWEEKEEEEENNV